jgi:predicted phage gp36 major capsid-like protein
MVRIIAPLVLLFAAPAFAAEPPPHHSPEERLERALDAADADDTQRNAIETLFRETLPAIKAMHEEGHALRDELREAFLAETVNPKVVEDIRRDGIDLMDRMSSTVLDTMVAAANVLRQDQRVKLAEMHEAHHERMRRMHEQE